MYSYIWKKYCAIRISLKYRKIICRQIVICSNTRTASTSRIPVYTYHVYVSYTRIHVPRLRLVYPYTRTTTTSRIPVYTYHDFVCIYAYRVYISYIRIHVSYLYFHHTLYAHTIFLVFLYVVHLLFSLTINT